MRDNLTPFSLFGGMSNSCFPRCNCPCGLEGRSFVFHCSASHRAYLTCEIIFKQHRLCLFTQSEKRGEEITSSVEQSHPQEIGPEEEIENEDGDVEVVLSLVQPSAELDMEEEKEKADVDGLTPTVLILSGCKTPQFLSNFYQFKHNTQSSKWSPEGGGGYATSVKYWFEIILWLVWQLGNFGQPEKRETKYACPVYLLPF